MESTSTKPIADKFSREVYESLARYFLPRIQEYYRTEEGQKAFADWKAQQAEKSPASPAKKKRRSDMERKAKREGR